MTSEFDQLPEATQLDIEQPEPEVDGGWMKTRYEEVKAISQDNLLAQDKNWQYTDVHAGDTQGIKSLIDMGYALAPEHPKVSEKNQIMVFKISRAKYEMKYKAEVAAKNLKEAEVLDREAKGSGVDSKTKAEAMTFSDAIDRMKDTDENFDTLGRDLAKEFERQLTEQ